ncbi:40S ribosomal protein S19 [Candidatus Micrarchaeota archaeon]|nr:40S ribosomal protein S19 [Candidatus Micrarchaeota archaeon]
MSSVLDHPANVVISAASEELKKNAELAAPEWVGLVKNSSANERLPQDEDFWFKRLASLLLTVYKRGPVGIERLRNKYGGRTGHTVSRSHHRKAGGKVIRSGLQKLEKIGFIEKDKTKKGRIITSKGVSFLEKCMKEKK